MSPDLITRIDEWIHIRPGYVSRQEAVRQLVSLALDRDCQFATDNAGRESEPPVDAPGGARPQAT